MKTQKEKFCKVCYAKNPICIICGKKIKQNERYICYRKEEPIHVCDECDRYNAIIETYLYDRETLEVNTIRIGKEYLEKAVQVLTNPYANDWGSIKITVKNEYPIRLENEDFIIIIAPRVEIQR